MDTWDGEYNENNAPTGLGTMTYKNGDIYEGYFENGMRNGFGTLTTKRGKKMG